MFRSAGITFGSKLLAALVNFAVVVWLSRWLGEAGKGQCSLYVLIFSAALIFSECISGATIGYLLSKYSHRQLLLLFYGWSALAALVTGGFFLGIGKIGLAETGWILLLNWLNALLAIHQQVAVGKQKFAFFNGLNIAQALCTLAAILIVFRLAPKEPLTYLWALGAAWLPIAATGFLYTYFLEDTRSFTRWPTLMKAGFTAGLSNQASTFIQLINTRIAYVLLPAAGTGIYSNAVSLCEACLLLNYSIGTVQYSRIVGLEGERSELSETEIRQQQVGFTQQCFGLNAVLMLLALTVLALIPGAFYGWLFGPAFAEVVRPLRLLLPGIWMYSGFVIFSYFFSGTGRFWINSIPALTALGVTLTGYGICRGVQAPLTISLTAIISSASYAALFVTALVLFLNKEKIPLLKWIQFPWGNVLNELRRK